MSKAESVAEEYLCERVRARGGLCLKLAMIGRRNFPDRTVLAPGGKIFFVECKMEKKDPTKTQSWFARILTKLGFTTYVCRSKEDVHRILKSEKMEST